MQLLQDNNYLTKSKELNVNQRMADALSDHQSLKDKHPSNASLLKMNPVASGDNVVATILTSAHKLKDDALPLVPCCEGKELQINQDLVGTGLSAISVKHNCSVIQCVSLSSAVETLQVAPGIVKHRNSFRSLHRPDLKRVPYLRRMTADEIETFFRGYSTDTPKRSSSFNDDKRQDAVKITMPEKKDTARSKIPKEKAEGGLVGKVSRAEDVPSGMRLHGARARLYTSVLAGIVNGDHVEGASLTGDAVVEADAAQDEAPADEDENDDIDVEPQGEELQTILPPRLEDVLAESTITEFSIRTNDSWSVTD